MHEIRGRLQARLQGHAQPHRSLASLHDVFPTYETDKCTPVERGTLSLPKRIHRGDEFARVSLGVPPQVVGCAIKRGRSEPDFRRLDQTNDRQTAGCTASSGLYKLHHILRFGVDVLMMLKEDLGDYRYRALNHQNKEIRLFCLEPGHASQPLRGSLVQVPITEVDKIGGYEAVSYSWGNPKDRVSLSMDGKSLYITRSFAVALIHLRSEMRTRVLWCDQICIDQRNVEERGSQVGLMFEIFGSARAVIAWLGPSTQFSGAGMAVFDDLSKRSEHLDVTPLWMRLPLQEVVAGLEDIMTRTWCKSNRHECRLR